MRGLRGGGVLMLVLVGWCWVLAFEGLTLRGISVSKAH
jgi:hypothetical protein